MELWGHPLCAAGGEDLFLPSVLSVLHQTSVCLSLCLTVSSNVCQCFVEISFNHGVLFLNSPTLDALILASLLISFPKSLLPAFSISTSVVISPTLVQIVPRVSPSFPLLWDSLPSPFSLSSLHRGLCPLTTITYGSCWRR